ncbi:MAG: family intrarane metalloprotease [Mucilaginibacter sp.]|nr:family intrarane metalloprotease [Mucilaginibacter sp.]
MDYQIFDLQKKQRNLILITGMVLSVLLPFGLGIGIRYLNIGYFDKMVFFEFTKWGTVVFLFFYAYKVERQPLLIWKGGDSSIGFILLSVVVLFVLYVIISVVSSIPASFGYHESNDVMRQITVLLKGHPVFIFFVSITAGVTEELIFRGYLLTRLSTFFKEPHIPVIVSSAIFSGMHYKYHSLGEFIFTFLLGVVFSFYYLKYRNIHALILIHFFIDFIFLTSAQHFY